MLIDNLKNILKNNHNLNYIDDTFVNRQDYKEVILPEHFEDYYSLNRELDNIKRRLDYDIVTSELNSNN